MEETHKFCFYKIFEIISTDTLRQKNVKKNEIYEEKKSASSLIWRQTSNPKHWMAAFSWNMIDDENVIKSTKIMHKTETKYIYKKTVQTHSHILTRTICAVFFPFFIARRKSHLSRASTYFLVCNIRYTTSNSNNITTAQEKIEYFQSKICLFWILFVFFSSISGNGAWIDHRILCILS